MLYQPRPMKYLRNPSEVMDYLRQRHITALYVGICGDELAVRVINSSEVRAIRRLGISVNHVVKDGRHFALFYPTVTE